MVKSVCVWGGEMVYFNSHSILEFKNDNREGYYPMWSSAKCCSVYGFSPEHSQ